VSLPYGDGRLSLYLLLPDKKSSTDALAKELTREQWDQWMSRFEEREGSVTLPRFKMEYRADLIPVMKALGLTAMFEQSTDFSGISSSEPLYVSAVDHKAVIEINEEGTEAAAATSIGIAAGAAQAPSEAPFEFVADRPVHRRAPR
jgi:serpin B